jgi:alpha,alpha-trehalose phosphorylase
VIRHHAFPVEGWAVRADGWHPETLAHCETVFSVSNGYLGLRGNLDEGAPAVQHGTFVNGFAETHPLVYPESAYGFAQTDQTMLNLADGKVIRLWVDGAPLDVREGTEVHRQELDLRAGSLTRALVWRAPGGAAVRVRSTRLVSLTHRHLAVIRYEVEPVDGTADIVLSSELVSGEVDVLDGDDPREAAPDATALLPALAEDGGTRAVRAHVTRRSRMTVAAGMDHAIETTADLTLERRDAESRAAVVCSARLRPGVPLVLTKVLAYHTAREGTAAGLAHRVRGTLDAGLGEGFDALAAGQRAVLDDFWRRSDVVVHGDDALQQAVRFALFQILQASACLEGAGIAAKGLTGLGYGGQYFWDMETYVLSTLVYVDPPAARRALVWRHSILPAARRRARTLAQRGALFPWRTIDGEEASGYFPAGTAAYHIDADVAHAVRKYADVTGDRDFLFGPGAEILVETARMWASLGFHSERDGLFHIHGVTGPDEYTAIVNDNAYTNLMARENLLDAARVVERMAGDAPEALEALRDRVTLEPREPAEWRRAAEAMCVPYDEELGVHGQDAGFLRLAPWDFAGTPRSHHPLLLHYHPLVLYRHAVIKQADLVLAMLLRSEAFTDEEKRRNFDHYEPLTTGDSSLSACIQSIVAAEVGHLELAYEHLEASARVDLDDLAHNVRDGIHIAAMAGTWKALVHGFGGLRQAHGRLRFRPRLPARIEGIDFRIGFRGRTLAVEVRHGSATYRVEEGEALTVTHHGEEITLTPGTPVSAPISAR